MIFTRLLAIAIPTVSAWLVYCAAAWLVHHDSIYFRLREMGFAFISNAAEMIHSVGPIVSIVAGLVFGLPFILVCFRQAGLYFRTLALNLLAVIILLCGLGTMGALTVVSLVLLPPAWAMGMHWAATRKNQSTVAPNGGDATSRDTSGATEKPPSVN